MDTKNRPLLLLTNDDGIHAPGIKHLWEALKDIADLTIVAPSANASGSGVSITWTRPLHARHVDDFGSDTKAWALNGTPADCVKMALSALLPRRPDLILSGINEGSNSGRTVLYSGTVGGIIEGSMSGIPGIAFSFSDLTPPPLSATKKYITSLVTHFLQNGMPAETFLNVNFPFLSADRILGIRFAKQGRGYMKESPDLRLHPEGFPYYWLGGKWFNCEEDPESDVALLEQGYITAVPLRVTELTDHAFLEQCKAQETKVVQYV
jgi:5'-nucleotidase